MIQAGAKWSTTRRLVLLGAFCILTSPHLAFAQSSLRIEIATEPGLAITAPQDWAKLLARLGYQQVRLRGQRQGDSPRIDVLGTTERPTYELLAILTARQELVVPGRRFRPQQVDALRDYLMRLAAEGPDGVIAEKRAFGLTLAQFEAVHDDLSQPTPHATTERPLAEFIDETGRQLKHAISIDAGVRRTIDGAPNIADDLTSLSVGTSLAIALRSTGLSLQPYKPLGKPVELRVVASPADADDAWPIGWDPGVLPRQTLPILFEKLDVEIDGFSLAETLSAVQPRLDVPFLLDHWALSQRQIDPATTIVKIPAMRTYYKRVLDLTFSKARVRGLLRVDEAGNPFYWITSRRRVR